MKKYLVRMLFLLAAVTVYAADDYQLPDPHFEDWSGTAFNGEIQPKHWHGSNVEQSAVGMTFRFNFMYRDTGRSGYCAMTKGQEVGAAGITENAPGYFSLAEAWQYLKGLDTGSATAGSKGGITFTHRPDSVSVWIKRTGPNTDKEDFHILFYSWSGTSKGKKYLCKSGGCTETPDYIQNEESDIRQVLDGNECGTSSLAKQVAEAWLKDRKTYSNWTRIVIPIYYINDEIPTNCNMMFSASNYPNFRANNGLYKDNALYVDDVELIYSSKIQELWVGGKKWNAFDPNNTTGVQVFALGNDATSIPSIEAYRGVGTLTTKGDGYERASKFTKTFNFPGRKLVQGSGKEMQVALGDLNGKETTITVRAEDGSSTTTYRVLFQRAESDNAKLAGLSYVLGNDTVAISNFSFGKNNYDVELPYGTTQTPKVLYTLGEEKQTVQVTEATSPTGKATLVVTAPSKKVKETYTVQFSIGLLKDNTLKSILVNDKQVPGFSPAQTVYKVSLPNATMPTVEAVSAYPEGEQTITYKAPESVDGGQYQINVSTPGNPTPKVYKLNFKIEKSSYSRLANLQVVGEQVATGITAFDPATTTYYVNLMMGTTELPAIVPEPGDEYQTIEILSLEPGVVDGTVRVKVTAGNGTDQTVYKIVFKTEKSEISTLSGILIGGLPIDSFRPDKIDYTYELPIGTTELPSIEPVKGDPYQDVAVTTGGVNGKTRISVTAGTGATTIYTITFSVPKYEDNTLKSLSVGPGYSLQDENYNPIAFDPKRNDYWVKLESDSLPTVTYEAQSEQYQTIDIFPTTSPNGKYRISVRPLNGMNRSYTIKFVYELSDNTKLQMIYVNDTLKNEVTPIPGFSPEVLDYTFTLDTGRVIMPDVTYDKSEPGQNVTVKWDEKKKNVVRLIVTAENEDKQTYKVTFKVPSAASTQLDSIQLVLADNDTIQLPGFRKDVYDYTYSLPTGMTCPKILVYKATTEQQVMITSPYAAGVATILVQMEGDQSQYTIDFVQTPAEAVQLSDIKVNGASLKEQGLFQPATLSYDGGAYPQLPTVEGVAEGANVEVTVRWKGMTAYVQVEDKTTHDKAIYSIAFTRLLSNDASLTAIYANGELIEGFDKTRLVYEYDLAAGSTYPVLTYTASDPAAQVLFFGQLAEGQWGITVMAENGDETTYTVQYFIAQYDDATLANMTVEGFQIAFDPNTFSYNLTLDQGAELPQVTVEAREGQTVIQTNESATKQQVIVYAESGAHNTYVITYERVVSTNALLADIWIDGVSLEGFDPMVSDYIDTLAWRTTVVPNVFPVGQVSNQTITTYYSRPNGVTRIHVVAQSGDSKDYTIAFPVRRSNNTKLEDMYLDSEDVEIRFKANQTDYVVTLPYEATDCPKIVVEKAEPEQRVDILSRPIGQTSEITVTAENGDTRTYTILFQRAMLKSVNALQSIYIKELDIELSKPKTTFEYTIELPFGSRSMTVEYEKLYPEQTVFIEPGGVNNPTYITVKANNDTVADVVYTLTPVVPTDDPATLTDIRVNGSTIPGFTPERFTYIVPFVATAEYKRPTLKYTLKKGAEIEIINQTSKHWEAQVTYGEGENARTNTYHVWYYYTQEQIPNADFDDEFVACETFTSAKKPKYWNTIADVLGTHGVFSPSTLVSQKSAGIVELQTQYSWSGGGMIPGFITLGTVTGNWGVAGSSSFGISGGIPFHNSPDEIIFNYKLESVSTKNQIQYILTGGDGTTTLEWNETETSGSYKDYKYSLKEANEIAGDPTTLNILINSYKQIDGTIVAGGANMLVDYIKLTYNHTLKSLQVNGVNATKSGSTFTRILPKTESERIEKPVLTFVGEVADQAQLVTWKAPTKDANYETRTATIVNYAENGTDHTDYSLTFKRPLDEKNRLASLLLDTVQITGFAADKTNYTVVLPAACRHLPDLKPVPGSSLQTVKTVFNEADSTMTITVTPEKPSVAKTIYTVKFTKQYSHDVTLANISVDGLTFDPEQTVYEITAEQLPLITFDKQSDLQTVSLVNGVITVTAEDGVTKGTYTIKRVDPTVVPNGVMEEFEQGEDVISDLGGTTMTKEAAKPSTFISFTRAQATDSVIFVQAPDKMTWSVPETDKTYTWLYPTTQSANKDLRQLTVNGAPYAEFIPSQSGYELISDSTVVLVVTEGESSQTLTTTWTAVPGGVVYSVAVKAENDEAQTYTIQVTRPMSGIATLDGILLDEQMIDGFLPEKTNYTYTIPASKGAKTEQPKMPNIRWIAGHPGQTITLQTGELNGDATLITVTGEDENETSYYYVTVNAEPSHCSDLTGITVNGEALDYFEPGRHFYSVSLNADERDLDYTADDRFLTVEHRSGVISEGHHYSDTLHVVAEDGSYSDYIIEIYVENRSNDAQLANILLNGKSMDKFDSNLFFDGGNNTYECVLRGNAKVPEVSAQLKTDGQQVEIEYEQEDKLVTVRLLVTAVDGVTKNTYVIRFKYELNNNSLLQEIEIANNPIADFDPNTYFYTYDLKPGEAMPKVNGTPDDEDGAKVEVVYGNGNAKIIVKAEDYEDDPKHISTYSILFNVKLSSKATLDVLYQIQDSMSVLEGFDANTFDYEIPLKVGTEHFPTLFWPEDEPYPTVEQEIVKDTPYERKYRLTVTAEDTTYHNIYYVTYTIQKSTNDSLRMIYIYGKDGKKMKIDQDTTRCNTKFDPDVLEYRYVLEASEAAELNGALPQIKLELFAPDWQTDTVIPVLDQSNKKTLGLKHVIMVTAQAGNTRTYTIQYPVKESNDTTLAEIRYGKERVPGFDPEGDHFSAEIGLGEEIPLISVTKKEEAQIVDILPDGDVVTIVVTAENGAQHTYTITFTRVKSSIATLDNIFVLEKGKQLSYDQFFFDPNTFEYAITMPYDPNRTSYDVPEIKWVMADTLQTVEMVVNELSEVKKEVLITVVSPNEENETVYKLTFFFTRNNDATLTSVTVGEDQLEFSDMNFSQTIVHPFGSERMYNEEDISEVVTSDPLATYTVEMDENSIFTIRVLAQDETTDRTYYIYQELGKDTCNTLQMIYLNDIELECFAPEKDTLYVFKLRNSEGLPNITVRRTSDNVLIDTDNEEQEDGLFSIKTKSQPGDTVTIECISLSGKKRVYRIYFEVSGVNYGRPHPTDKDVFLRRFGASQLLVATINSDVTFVLYNQEGQIISVNKVPVANPNDIEVAKYALKDSEDDGGGRKDVLLDVIDPSCGLLINIEQGQIYFYSFMSGGGHIKSGKIIAMP